MGCPCRTHINTHLGPMWVLYVLLAGKDSDNCTVHKIIIPLNYLSDRISLKLVLGKGSHSTTFQLIDIYLHICQTIDSNQYFCIVFCNV